MLPEPKRKNRIYTREFKEEAVALVIDQGYSVSEAAKSLGIDARRLHDWKKQLQGEKYGTALTVEEREELKRLRKENKRLLMEKEILKKASAFFAKEMK